MPELPEVETVVRGLRPSLIGQTIRGAVLPAVLEQRSRRMLNVAAEELNAAVSDQPILAVERRAKYILLHLQEAVVAVHLKMTGRLYILPTGEVADSDRYLRITFPLAGGQELRFSDARRFGRVYVGASIDRLLPILGPEPLDDAFTVEALRAQLANRHGVLKALLLDQSFVAGIGNIYADESLHIAGIHPKRAADSLSDGEIEQLHGAIRQALNDGIKWQGASIRWYRQVDGTKGQSQDHFRVYHDPRSEKDKRCPVCDTPIVTIRVGQRGTHFCPICQPAL